MTNLLYTIIGGDLIVITVFFAFYVFKRMTGKYAAIITALLTLLVYVPISILNWPGGDVFAMHIAIYMVTIYLLGIITSYREKRITAEGIDKVGFHWGPAAIIAFFVVFITLDTIFVAVATQGLGSEWMQRLFPKQNDSVRVESNFPGTVANDYQKQQAQYNEYLEQMQEQSSRGWKIKKGWQSDPWAMKQNTFLLQLQDKQGKAIDNATIKGRFLHPSNSKRDISFELKEVEPGLYAIDLIMPVGGRWDLYLQIWHGEDYYESQSHTMVNSR